MALHYAGGRVVWGLKDLHEIFTIYALCTQYEDSRRPFHNSIHLLDEIVVVAAEGDRNGRHSNLAWKICQEKHTWCKLLPAITTSHILNCARDKLPEWNRYRRAAAMNKLRNHSQAYAPLQRALWLGGRLDCGFDRVGVGRRVIGLWSEC